MARLDEVLAELNVAIKELPDKLDKILESRIIGPEGESSEGESTGSTLKGLLSGLDSNISKVVDGFGKFAVILGGLNRIFTGFQTGFSEFDKGFKRGFRDILQRRSSFGRDLALVGASAGIEAGILGRLTRPIAEKSPLVALLTEKMGPKQLVGMSAVAEAAQGISSKGLIPDKYGNTPITPQFLAVTMAKLNQQYIKNPALRTQHAETMADIVQFGERYQNQQGRASLPVRFLHMARQLRGHLVATNDHKSMEAAASLLRGSGSGQLSWLVNLLDVIPDTHKQKMVEALFGTGGKAGVLGAIPTLSSLIGVKKAATTATVSGLGSGVAGVSIGGVSIGTLIKSLVSSGAGYMAGAGIGVAGVVLAFTAALKFGLTALDNWNKKLIQGNQQFAPWNAALGSAFARMGVQEWQREYRIGKLVEGTGVKAMADYNDAQNRLVPHRAAWQNFKNLFSRSLSAGTRAFADSTSWAANAFNWVAGTDAAGDLAEGLGYVGYGALVGAIIGGVIGFFAGGVGIIPGAKVGAMIGGTVGAFWAAYKTSPIGKEAREAEFQAVVMPWFELANRASKFNRPPLIPRRVVP